jgi:hypothetical protein
MSLSAAVVLVALGILLVLLVKKKRRRGSDSAAAEVSTAVNAWIRGALEAELLDGVLGTRGVTTTDDERARLARTLRGEPDPEMVGAIEDAVRSVDLEYVRYAHEPDCELTMRVVYEDGRTGTARRRMELGEIPRAVREDFEKKGSSRVFRPWDFPWAKAS